MTANRAAPNPTRMCVRKPAGWSVSSRSPPSNPARALASKRRRTRSACDGTKGLCLGLTVNMWRDSLAVPLDVVAPLLPGGRSMRCPWCGYPDDKVVDSRSAEGGASVRRRRECFRCGRRFTTFERLEEVSLSVVKRDGSKEPFDRSKVVAGVMKAIKNRPVSEKHVSQLVDRVEEKLRRKAPVVTTQEVGVEVLTLLRRLDDVAYLRFASVYKDFQELTDFERELGILLPKREPAGSADDRRRTRSSRARAKH